MRYNNVKASTTIPDMITKPEAIELGSYLVNVFGVVDVESHGAGSNNRGTESSDTTVSPYLHCIVIGELVDRSKAWVFTSQYLR